MVQETSAKLVQAQMFSITTRQGVSFTVNAPLPLPSGDLDEYAYVAAILESYVASDEKPAASASEKPEESAQGSEQRTPAVGTATEPDDLEAKDFKVDKYRIISRGRGDKNPMTAKDTAIVTIVRAEDVIRWDWFMSDKAMADEIAEVADAEKQAAAEFMAEHSPAEGSSEQGTENGAPQAL